MQSNKAISSYNLFCQKSKYLLIIYNMLKIVNILLLFALAFTQVEFLCPNGNPPPCTTIEDDYLCADGTLPPCRCPDGSIPPCPISNIALCADGRQPPCPPTRTRCPDGINFQPNCPQIRKICADGINFQPNCRPQIRQRCPDGINFYPNCPQIRKRCPDGINFQPNCPTAVKMCPDNTPPPCQPDPVPGQGGPNAPPSTETNQEQQFQTISSFSKSERVAVSQPGPSSTQIQSSSQSPSISQSSSRTSSQFGADGCSSDRSKVSSSAGRLLSVTAPLSSSTVAIKSCDCNPSYYLTQYHWFNWNFLYRSTNPSPWNYVKFNLQYVGGGRYTFRTYNFGKYLTAWGWPWFRTLNYSFPWCANKFYLIPSRTPGCYYIRCSCCRWRYLTMVGGIASFRPWWIYGWRARMWRIEFLPS